MHQLLAISIVKQGVLHLFLCVFGFPGEKLACESTHALECAMQILCMASTELGKLQ